MHVYIMTLPSPPRVLSGILSSLAPRGPPASTLFPYTTLFRSEVAARLEHVGAVHHLLGGHLAVGADADPTPQQLRSEEHTSELQSHVNVVCRLPPEKKNNEVPSSLHRAGRRWVY